MNSDHNSRRNFLKNTSLAALSIGIIPSLKGNTKHPGAPKSADECNPTTLDYYGQGPFYTANPPLLVDGQLADVYETGTRLILTGRIYNLDCTEVIPNTLIDVWHANDAGQYDNSGYNLRGFTYSNSQGFYLIETIYPGKYLNGGSYRPSHIHFRITPTDSDMLITQLYFEGDPDLDTDAASSITEGEFDATHRRINLTENDEGQLEGVWDISIDGDGIVGVNDIHIDKGMIYSAGPNPFRNEIEIKYGVFKPSRVDLLVYNLQGKLVANLEESNMQEGKYSAFWKPESGLPSGYYFIALKINDLQVNYIKVLKQK